MPVETALQPLETQQSLHAAVAQSHVRPIVLFKHSTACGTSAWARREVLDLTDPDDPPVYEVVVQHARVLSNEIASHFAIKHESPQAIVLYRGRPIFQASHHRVKAEAIREAVTQAQ